jgi:hypothetical protein
MNKVINRFHQAASDANRIGSVHLLSDDGLFF